jgi:malate dehydrogenase (oxaloacetate-decarboxylating)
MISSSDDKDKKYKNKNTILETWIRGPELLDDPYLNKGIAFTVEERKMFVLTGLLPAGVTILEQQAKKVYQQYQEQADDLGKNIYLTALHDRNEILFYYVLCEPIREMLSIV